MAAVYRPVGLTSSEEMAPRASRILAVGRAVASRLDETTRDVDHGELLYDERGLPR